MKFHDKRTIFFSSFFEIVPYSTCLSCFLTPCMPHGYACASKTTHTLDNISTIVVRRIFITGIDQMKRKTVVVLHERYINLNEEEEKINIFTIKNSMKWNWHFTFALHVADEIKFIIAWNISRWRKEKCNNKSTVNWKQFRWTFMDTHRSQLMAIMRLTQTLRINFSIVSYLNSSEHLTLVELMQSDFIPLERFFDLKST